MSLFSEIELHDPKLARLVERRAAVLEGLCREMELDPKDARLVVMWGGGKDSTLALVLTKAVADLLGCSVHAVTMAHPGLSPHTIANVEHIAERIGVAHQWRQFVRVVAAPHTADEEWVRLYGALARATDFHPRFMCVACNFGSIVVEFEALTDLAAHFRVTGNPPWELQTFDEWMTALRTQFAQTVAFPERVELPMLDYFRSWWAVYDALLSELTGLAEHHPKLGGAALSPAEFLYPLPPPDDAIGGVRIFSVIAGGDDSYVPLDYHALLTSLGWRLPDDIQGGTESDCMMPAAIAALDIQRSGLDVYKEHLAHTASVLKPLPEMYDRAMSWAVSGRSTVEGEKLLTLMRIPEAPLRTPGNGTPIATALVSQLLPVR